MTAKDRANRRRQRRLLTIAMAAVFAAAVLAAGIFLIVRRADRALPMPEPYSNGQMVYVEAGETAQMTDTAMTRDLCVGDGNIADTAIELEGDVRAALFSLDERKVLYARDMYEQVYPASITKIMTAIVALKYGNMNEMVTVKWMDLELESGSQVAGLQIGDRLRMSELMRALLVHSGNDAAQAIARVIGGNMDSFVDMMNEELNEIGCTGTHFTNPTGLHDPDHYTTVYDIYLMLNEAIKYDEFVNIMQVGVYDLGVTDRDGDEKHITLDSTDHYLTGEYDPPKDVTVLGGKTGTTSQAGHCLAIESQNAYGQPYISIVVGASTADELYGDMNILLGRINS